MRCVRYDKYYNTRTIRSIFLMFITMLDSNEIDFDLFRDYTGSYKRSYSKVRKAIIEMISDLNLRCSYEIVKYPQINRYTRYFTYSYTIKKDNQFDYSYNISPYLTYEKKINYSMTIVYLMLKNNEVVTYKKLAAIFPLFTRKRFRTLMDYLSILIDEDLYCEKKIYKLREYNYE